MFFNKEHIISKTYFEYVENHDRPDVNTFFSDFLRSLQEATLNIFGMNKPESYVFTSISLVNANRYLNEINTLCGCELTLTANDFPEWMRSTVR
jgi:hypothetical protein